jgi:hypothetical protein
MNNRALTWSKLDWKDFQKVSLFLYRRQTGDFAAEEFLKQGHFQSGIDLLSFRQESGKHVCIQCKHEVLTFAKLKKIVPLFLAGEYGESTETFIITTTADLQEPKIQSWITAQKIALRKQYAMAFDVWDVQRLEDALKSHYLLVEKYFGIAEASGHCFQPALQIPDLKPFPGFIKRHIQSVADIADAEDRELDSKIRSSLTLTELMKSPTDKKGFCLIAEAYEGKSSLIRHTAWELGQLDLGIVALPLDLKFCSVLTVAQLLTDHYASWQSVPAKDLVVLIDGLDEVPAEQFHTVVGHIRDFARNHPAVRLVFTCRKMFYSYQNLEHELPDFGFYELLDLHLRQIFDYLEEHLGGEDKAMSFYIKMRNLSIDNLIETPFYLIQLVKWFNDPVQEMPKTKFAIATRFVDESLNVSATRKLRSGLSLDKYKTKYRNALQQLALLLQIKGLNACQDELLQELFSQDDIDLLTHSSILNIRNGQWSFINALFQEQLAALALEKLEADAVINLITVGDKILKISRKWIQTLATYLSLLPENNADREQLVAVIEADNIELLALSEGSKFSPEFRLDVLQKILGRTNRHQARLVVIDESNLAAFAGNSDTVVDELLSTLLLDTAVIVKIVACRTIRYTQLSASQASRYAALAKELLIVIHDPDLGRLLLEAIAHYKLGDDLFLTKFKLNPLLASSHELRQGLYQYMAAHDLIDQHYDWLLSGFPVLYTHNTSISHFGSEKKLIDLVVKTRSGKRIRELLQVVQGKDFQKFFRDDKDTTKAFYSSLAGACAEIYTHDPWIIFAVVNFLVASGRHQYEREAKGVTEFFELTQTYSLGLRIALLAEKDDLQTYTFSGALHPSCEADILYAVEEGIMDRAKFNICCSALYYGGRRGESDRLEELAEKIFGLKNEPSPEAVGYRAAQERKKKNDLTYIGSREAFREGIIVLFDIAGKKSIPIEELYQRFDEDNPLIEVNSTLMSSFITLQANDREATLEDCLFAVDDDQYFKTWRADKLRQSYIIQYYPELVKGEIKRYYDEEINIFPFDDLTMGSPNNLLAQARQLLKIWAEYQYPTLDHVLLKFIRVNKEGYNGIEHAEINKRKSITALLLKHFDDRQHLLKQRVLSNLQIGLSSQEVIGTHLEFCRVLHIIEARPYILDLVLTGRVDTWSQDRYMSLYVSLGGQHADFLPVFMDINDLNGYLFMFMVKFLWETHKQVVIERLLVCLRSPETTIERKNEASRHLAHLGNEEGFMYMLSKFEAGKPAPFDIQGKLETWNVPTAWGLKQLRPMMHMLLDKKTEKLRFHHSPKNLLLEILNGFASKSENDLEMVTSFMNRCADELASEYPLNSGHLGWHAEQMTERYREISYVPLTNREIKSLFGQITG